MVGEVEFAIEFGEEKNPAGQDGSAIQAPLSESCDEEEQAVQKEGVPEQVEQEESQAEIRKSVSIRRKVWRNVRIHVVPLATVPDGHEARQRPSERNVPARQAEQVNCDLVDKLEKLSIEARVHLAGAAVSPRRQQ